ncbi:MAG TPA: single-stranded DNA-binding protein [Bacteroidales bacterium]|jgi:single-strand DNA-binding protein|nr:single-stranded DNA-binding protein [Bacteroidales bacterium]
MINKAILIGNVGKDPDVRTTATNKKVAKFSLATSEKRKDAEAITSWHSIVVWDKLAEIVEKYVKKGMMLYIDGKINYGKYDDKDGNTHYYTEIIANNIQMLSKKPSDVDDDVATRPDPQAEDDLPWR